MSENAEADYRTFDNDVEEDRYESPEIRLQNGSVLEGGRDPAHSLTPNRRRISSDDSDSEIENEYSPKRERYTKKRQLDEKLNSDEGPIFF